MWYIVLIFVTCKNVNCVGSCRSRWYVVGFWCFFLLSSVSLTVFWSCTAIWFPCVILFLCQSSFRVSFSNCYVLKQNTSRLLCLPPAWRIVGFWGDLWKFLGVEWGWCPGMVSTGEEFNSAVLNVKIFLQHLFQIHVGRVDCF